MRTFRNSQLMPFGNFGFDDDGNNFVLSIEKDVAEDNDVADEAADGSDDDDGDSINAISDGNKVEHKTIIMIPSQNR